MYWLHEREELKSPDCPGLFFEANIRGGWYLTDHKARVLTRDEFQRLKNLVARWDRFYYNASPGQINQVNELCRHNSDPLSKSKSETTHEAEEGFVYLAKAAGKYKIGRSKKPKDRIQHFDTQMPIDVEEIHRFRADDYKFAEETLHNYASNHRVEGEWFELSDEVVAIIQDIAEYRDGTFFDVHDGEEINDSLIRALG